MESATRYIPSRPSFVILALVSLLCTWLHALTLQQLFFALITLELAYTWTHHQINAGSDLRYVFYNLDVMDYSTDDWHLSTLILMRLPVLRKMPWRPRRKIGRSFQFWFTMILYGSLVLLCIWWYGIKTLNFVMYLETTVVWKQKMFCALGMDSRLTAKQTPLHNLKHNPIWALYMILETLMSLSSIGINTDSKTWAAYWAHLLCNTTLCLYIAVPRPARMLAKKEITRSFFDADARTYYCTECKRTMDQRQEVVKSGGGIEDITHHFWKSNLRRAAEKGCRICAAVWQHWVRTPISAPALLGFWQPVTSYTWSRDGQRLEISSKPAGWFLTTSDKFVFRVFDIQENELQWRSINRTIDLCTWSPRIIERAKLWLLDCISNHERCTSSLQDKIYLPTRLVRIAQEARKLKLSLYQTGANTEKIRYATLSHCWGNIKGGQLIAENYDDYVSDIPTQSLPLNFRHAVRIAADLGLEFIWIDSLCIVQGSKKDWDHEAPTMRSIYANSVCNIAATDASDSTQGLIFKRDPIAILPSAFGKDRSAFLSNETDLFDHPLYRRAWVMQELLLAPRTLHFSRAQVHWSCNTAKASEVYPSINFDWTAGQIDHHPARNFSVLHGSSQSTILNARMLETQFKAMLGYDQTEIAQFPSNNAESRSVLYPRADSSVARVSHYGKVRSFGRHPFNQWAALVESYTKMNITMSSDRPIALHGVVTLLTPYLGQFIGGVWRTFLPMELLWETRITSWRPRTYQAPSWSWLSVEGPITYSRCFRHHPGQTFIATITDMHIEYDENNMIVATPPAWLRIRGKLAKAYWEGQGFRYIHKAKGVPVIREVCPAQATQEPEGEEASFFFDDARYAPRLFFDEYQDRYHLDEDIYLLAIRHAFPEDDVDEVGSVDGLVLRRSEGLSHFTRVGIFSDAHCLQLLPFFDCLSESEIVIV